MASFADLAAQAAAIKATFESPIAAEVNTSILLTVQDRQISYPTEFTAETYTEDLEQARRLWLMDHRDSAIFTEFLENRTAAFSS